MSNVTVFGAGSWGTALATVLAENDHNTLLWSHRQDQADEIHLKHTNEKYLPGTVLPNNLKATSNVEEAVAHAELIVMAVPTKGIRETCQKIMKTLDRKLIFVHVSKGIEPDTLIRISNIMKEELDESVVQDVVALSGPSHAEEVVKHHPTTVASACENLESAAIVQDLFMNQYFRVYTNEDIVGVELGGALKNVIALGAGVSDGIGFGDNAKAALITRGLAEISRLGVKMGANPLTFMGLAGMGDLIVTCTSVHSRNWRAGNLLGKGLKLEEVLEQMGMVVEGVRTTKAAHQLAAKYDVSMPITEGLYEVLFEDQSPKEIVEKLMLRMKKTEMDGKY